jgi:ABC-type glycerol-3-phosphate transport system permease component
MRQSRRFSSVVKHGFLVGVCLFSLYPIWFIVQTSLKTNAQYLFSPLGLPWHATLSNFREVLGSLPVPSWAANSAIVTLVSAVASTAIAMPAAYAFTFGSFRGRSSLINSNIAFMVVPPVVLLAPMFTLMVNVHLINHLPSVVVFYTGLFLPFSVFFLTNFMGSVPNDVIEAAKLDGLSHFGTLWRIVAPLASPALFTLLLVNVIYGWNELLIALVFLQDDSSRTLMAGLSLFQGRYVTQQPLVMAGAFLSILPILALYSFGQRYFVRGLTAGIGK